MSRINGKFFYTEPTEDLRDPETGFPLDPQEAEADWKPGIYCQVDQSIPAKQRIGTDGQVYSYSYSVFVDRIFANKGDLAVGALCKVILEDGTEEVFTILGVDTLNRKYIEIWG